MCVCVCVHGVLLYPFGLYVKIVITLQVYPCMVYCVTIISCHCYLPQVRAVTSVGPGSYSDSFTLTVTPLVTQSPGMFVCLTSSCNWGELK